MGACTPSARMQDVFAAKVGISRWSQELLAMHEASRRPPLQFDEAFRCDRPLSE